ncbi:hypothetical protein [Bradyrhizobium sp.]
MTEQAASKLRYDDFIANVIPDPAKVEPTLLLYGFVGGGGAEGAVRIYSDPTLNKWVDVPEADIVHTMPIPDSKFGGSYVWARASAQIKPGNAAAAATEAPRQAPQAEAAVPTEVTLRCFRRIPPSSSPCGASL